MTEVAKDDSDRRQRLSVLAVCFAGEITFLLETAAVHTVNNTTSVCTTLRSGP